MIRQVLAVVGVMAFSPSLHAADLLDWLEEVSEARQASSATPDKHQAEVDNAALLTLESGEFEMYPLISPDGKSLLLVSGKRHAIAVTRRLLRNGDQLNEVSVDKSAFDSVAWHGNEHVTFLSSRGGDLGVWQKSAAGEGAVRRLQRLNNAYIQPVVLDGNGIIAVQLRSTTGRQLAAKKQTVKSVGFSNWDMKGKKAQLLHISQQGAVTSLVEGINPSLSPDGKRIVFSMQTGKSWHLYMIDVDGSNLIQLTNDRSVDVQPTWGPDGEWIAFTSNRGILDAGRNRQKINWDIWLIRKDGRHLSRLTTDEARDGAPAIAANGRVYFHSERNVDREDRRLHQVSGSTTGFHVWSVALPSVVE